MTQRSIGKEDPKEDSYIQPTSYFMLKSRSIIVSRFNPLAKKNPDILAKTINIRIATLVNSDGTSIGSKFPDIEFSLLSCSVLTHLPLLLGDGINRMNLSVEWLFLNPILRIGSC